MKLDFDPYAVLEVPRDASGAQIVQARRRLSRKYHPDLNSSPDAAERFDEVQRAAALLSDRRARAEYDRERANTAEAAPGVTVHPTSVDFGILQAGQPGREAAVTVSWTGDPPGRIACTPGNDWWTNIRAGMPDATTVSFVLRAQVHVGLANGPRSARFEVTIDDRTVGVALTATVRGVPRAPAPGPIPAARTHTRYDPARRPAPATRPMPGRTAASIIYVVVLVLVLGLIFLGKATGGGGQVVNPVPTPPQAVTVPQSASASAAAAQVKPVFRINATLSADLRFADPGDGIVAAPVLHGLELVVEVNQSFTGLGGDCLDILPPGSTATTAVPGDVYNEYPMSIALGSGKDSALARLTYPAILPGAYSFDVNCLLGNLNDTASGPILGEVSVSHVGLVDGLTTANSMVVYSVHSSAAGTVVVYGAVGTPGDSLTPPADSACIGEGPGGETQRYWQPSQALVSQQANAKQEWYETGSLIFPGSGAGSPNNMFFYNCAFSSSAYDPPGLYLP